MWPPDPGSFSQGMLVSLIGWAIFIFVIFYPKINSLKNYFEDKEKVYMKKIDDILEGKDKKFNKIIDDKLPDITKGLKTEFKTVLDVELPAIVDKIKAEIPDIEKIIVDKAPVMMQAFLKELKPPLSPETAEAIYGLTDCAYASFVANPDIERSIQGKINGHINGIVSQMEGRIGFKEEDLKNLREMIAFFNANKEKFAQFANMAPGGGGGGPGGFNIMQMLGMGNMGMGQQ